jgi:hypothetical protein
MRTDAYFLGERNAKLSTNVAARNQIEKSIFWSAIGNALHVLFARIANGDEPRIWQKRDRNGQLVWHVYDPATSRASQFASEAEVRSWLDQRYYI